MPAIPIWRRIFVRSAAPDKDEIVDEQFRRAHFTDLFGQFLQQGENTNKKTFHDLISTFWGISKTLIAIILSSVLSSCFKCFLALLLDPIDRISQITPNTHLTLLQWQMELS